MIGKMEIKQVLERTLQMLDLERKNMSKKHTWEMKGDEGR
jgi:hypothetical protein